MALHGSSSRRRRRRLFFFLFQLAAFLLLHDAPSALFAASRGCAPSNTVQHADIAYGAGSSEPSQRTLTLDLILQKEGGEEDEEEEEEGENNRRTGAARPLMVFLFHGGFMSGSKHAVFCGSQCRPKKLPVQQPGAATFRRRGAFAELMSVDRLIGEGMPWP